MLASAGVVWAYLRVPIGLLWFWISIRSDVGQNEVCTLAKAEFEVIHWHNLNICNARSETINVSDSSQKGSHKCFIGQFRTAKRHVGLDSVISKVVKQ